MPEAMNLQRAMMLMSASNLINHNINSNCYGVETPLKN